MNSRPQNARETVDPLVASGSPELRIVQLAQDPGLKLVAQELVFEYMAMTGAETGRGPWNSPSDLPDRMASELGNISNFYAKPGAFFVAFLGNQPTGCGSLHAFDAHRADIRRLYVRDQFRGFGVAKTIMTSCISTARDSGFDAVMVDIVPSRTAVIDWYKRLGFQTIEPFEIIDIEMTYLGMDLVD